MNATSQFLTGGDTAGPHLTGICHYMGKAISECWIVQGVNQRLSLLISPANARIIAQDGYSKEDVREYVAQNARLSVGEINKELAYSAIRAEPITVHSLAEQGEIPKEWDVGLGENIPFIFSPELIDIFVCGSRQRNRNLIFRTSYCTSTTQEIRLHPIGSGS